MAMRDQIKKAIEEGGATKASLLELTGTTEKGLASQFTYLRMMGNCPMKQENGTWKIVTTEEWEAHRAAGGSKAAVNLTPKQRFEKAEKRSKKASSTFDTCKVLYDADTTVKMSELKYIRAEADFEIAEIELGQAEATYEETKILESTMPQEEEILDDDDESFEDEDPDEIDLD